MILLNDHYSHYHSEMFVSPFSYQVGPEHITVFSRGHGQNPSPMA